MFSTAQLFLKKTSTGVNKILLRTNPYLNDFLENYFPKKLVNDVDFIVDGKIVYSTTKTKLLNAKISEMNDNPSRDIPVNFQLIIYTELNLNKDAERPIMYKKILTSVPTEESQFKCEPALYKFVLTEILMDDKKIMTTFTNDKHNYFVVGNKINVDFIKYYLNKYHKNDLSKNDICINDVEKFDINILDQDVNVKHAIFSNNKTLVINKDNYEITI